MSADLLPYVAALIMPLFIVVGVVFIIIFKGAWKQKGPVDRAALEWVLSNYEVDNLYARRYLMRGYFFIVWLMIGILTLRFLEYGRWEWTGFFAVNGVFLVMYWITVALMFNESKILREGKLIWCTCTGPDHPYLTFRFIS